MKIYLIGFIATWIIIFGASNALSDIERENSYIFREVIGVNIYVSSIVATIWPLGLPIFACLTGFFRDGWQSLPGKSNKAIQPTG